MGRRQIAATIALIILMLGLLAPAFAQSAQTLAVSNSVKKGLDYLKGRQQSDGGFAERGSSSSDELTAWVVAGIKSAGVDPSSWRKSGKTPIDCLAAHARGWTKLTDLEKACLAVSSAGADPRSFGGRNLVADIKSHAGADGHIGGMVNDHCWGVIALSAAAEPLPAGAREWLVARQNIDGGYGYSGDSGSDPDDSGAALEALIAAGEDAKGNTVSRVLSYLHFCQAPDGGFSFQTDESNVGSTAWAVQGILAAGQNPLADDWKSGGRTPVDYLSAMQQSDGHFRFSKSNDTNLVWMTAETIPALMSKAYPLKKDSPAPSKTTGPAASTTTPPAQSGEVSQQAADPGAETTGPAQSGATTQGTAPAQAGKPGRSSKNGGAAKGATARERLAMSVQAGSSGEAGGGNGLALFGVICAMYLVVLGLAYVLVRALRGRNQA